MSLQLKRLGMAAFALIVMPLAAHATDLPRYKAPSYVAPSYSNWSGFYLGFNAGYGFGKSDWDIPAVSPSPKGGMFGLTTGYNYQTGTWVWGLEGDVDWTSIKGSTTCGAGTCETSNSWLGTARGRLGYAGWSNWMPYLTGGLAFGNIKAANTATGSGSSSRLGYSLGLGLEYMLWSNWSVKAEYLYVSLGKFDCGASCGGTPDNVSLKANVVRAGLNYRF